MGLPPLMIIPVCVRAASVACTVKLLKVISDKMIQFYRESSPNSLQAP